MTPTTLSSDSSAPNAPKAAAHYVATTAADFLPFPAVTLNYRGLNLSRSSLYRLRDAGEIRTKAFRITGGLKPRTFILRESLDAWIARQMSQPDSPRAASKLTR
jgi:hypothetical protein